MLSTALLLALIWGVLWALFLQCVPLGQFLARRRTWITVVVGVGVDLAIALMVVPFKAWWPVALVVGLSSPGIIVRSLVNEHHETLEELDAIQAATEKHHHLGA